MNHFIASLAWCWIQVLFVAAAATALSWLALRRSPAAGATIAWSGFIAALALTGIALMPFSEPAGPGVLSKLVVPQAPAPSATNRPTAAHAHVDRDEARATDFRTALSGPLFAKCLISLRGFDAFILRHPIAIRWTFFVLASLAAIGVLRLITGVVSISVLVRRSTIVSNHRAREILLELLSHLGIYRVLHLRETADLDCAAVVGWRRPVIMLPADWREWSDEELKAVLAHELAHIARHDALWRFVAAFAVALHWGQPCMHWLQRQFLLSQELAADELATAAMGGTRAYLQALASVALRHDRRSLRTARVSLVPVFSGFLLQRIVTLRAKPTSARRNWKHVTQIGAISLIAAIALLASAIRGLAEPPVGENPSNTPKAADAKPKSAVVTDNAQAIRPQLPKGWNGGGNPDYVVGLDQTVSHNGNASGFVKSTAAEPQRFGGLVTAVKANEYRGKRLRLSSYIMTNQVAQSAQMWMRIDGETRTVAFDNMQDRPLQGTNDWQRAEIVLDVPEESLNIHFGFFLIGSGQAWADDFQLETVAQDVATTKPRLNGMALPKKQIAIERRLPLNLGFEN